MLLKGENIPSSEGFPGQEDSSVEERQVSAEPYAPHLIPLERQTERRLTLLSSASFCIPL